MRKKLILKRFQQFSFIQIKLAESNADNRPEVKVQKRKNLPLCIANVAVSCDGSQKQVEIVQTYKTI